LRSGGSRVAVTRTDIVAAARSWIGVRYRHQGRCSLGVDCAGLIGAVAVQLGVVPEDFWEATFDPAFGGYGRLPVGDRLLRVCEAFMPAASGDLMPGDVVAMQFARAPMHMGFVADYRHGGLSLVHAMGSVGQVAEHRLSPAWRQRIVARYALPGVA